MTYKGRNSISVHSRIPVTSYFKLKDVERDTGLSISEIVKRIINSHLDISLLSKNGEGIVNVRGNGSNKDERGRGFDFNEPGDGGDSEQQRAETQLPDEANNGSNHGDFDFSG